MVSTYSEIGRLVLFFFDGKEQVTYLKGVDANYTKINSVSKNLFNGKWLRYKTAEVVVGLAIIVSIFKKQSSASVDLLRTSRG